MSDSLERIEKAFEEFRSKVAECCDETNPKMADIRDAYERFYRLCERHDHEHDAGTLSPTEDAALRKVFSKHKFIASVGRLRGLSSHVVAGDVELLDPDNNSFTLTPKSSAAAVFAAPRVRLTDKQEQIQVIDHPRWLAKAVEQIALQSPRLKRQRSRRNNAPSHTGCRDFIVQRLF
jgi:hypothetical protein